MTPREEISLQLTLKILEKYIPSVDGDSAKGVVECYNTIYNGIKTNRPKSI